MSEDQRYKGQTSTMFIWIDFFLVSTQNIIETYFLLSIVLDPVKKKRRTE